MYGEWVTLPELDGNTVVRVFVPCSPGTWQHKKEAQARKVLRHYLDRLDRLEGDAAEQRESEIHEELIGGRD